MDGGKKSLVVPYILKRVHRCGVGTTAPDSQESLEDNQKSI